MKIACKILTIGVLVGFVVLVGMAAWSLYDTRAQVFPESYKPWLDTDRSVYANVDTVLNSDFQIHAYDFDRNKYANAIPNAKRTSNVASCNGHLPSFKMGGDIFIVTFKWVSRSSGLAISDSPSFISKLESLDDYVSVEHLSGDIYAWNLHLNYTRQEADAR